MTRIVDGLERAGLAKRHPHPDDGRAMLVRATAKGRRIMERGRGNRVQLITGLLQGMPPDDLAAVARATAALAHALEPT